MKTINIVVLLIAFTIVSSVRGQVSYPDNDNGAPPGSYLGWDHGRNLEFRTNNSTYMQLMQNGNSTINGFTIDRSGFLGLSQDPGFFTSGVASPFSLLHLNGDNPSGFPQQDGYRDWMRYGITFTHNTDLMYIGPRANANDVTDAVIGWSDNPNGPNPWGPDVLRFLFLDGDGSAPSGAESSEGLELGRMTGTGQTGLGSSWSNSIAPKRTLDVVNTGSEPQFRITQENDEDLIPGVYTDFETSTEGHLHILPWSQNEEKNVAFGFLSATDAPTERIDVDGTARLRQVPNENPHVLITGKKQDVNPQDGDYVLNYLEFTGNSGDVLAGDGSWVDGTGTLCDWNIVAGGNDLATGYPGACVEGNVGIGIVPPGSAKLFVQDELDVSGDNGIQVRTPAIAPNTAGILAVIEAVAEEATNVTAVHGEAINSKFPVGGLFEATGDADFLTSPVVGVIGHATSLGPTAASYTSNAIGVYGLGTSSINCDRPIGVYGQAVNTTGCTTGYAGYFAGASVDTQTPITLSDESIKTDVNEIENATDLLQQIAPKSYNFIPSESVPNAYSSEMNYGFLAQQVQEVLPNVVQSVPAPFHMNEDGEIVSSGEELLGIQYGQFIPILVAGFQEQQSQIEAQDAEIADLQQSLADQNELMMQMMDQMELLQQQINGCCNGDALPKSFGSDDNAGPDAKPFGENELYQNVPNPFRGQTTIRYTLEQGGRAMLNIHDSNGREITQLENSEQVAGTYSYVWDATGLPAGTYHYSLVLDGELLVKRAIKLQD